MEKFHENLQKNESGSRIIIFIILLGFTFGSLGCLFYFLKTQIIRLTKKHLIISYQFLPFSKKILIEDIVRFNQIPKPVTFSRNLFDKGTIIHTMFETSVNLKNGKSIKTYSLNEFDFNEIRKLIEKVKRGESKIKIEKLTTRELIFQNLTVILFSIIMLILIIGLSNALING